MGKAARLRQAANAGGSEHLGPGEVPRRAIFARVRQSVVGIVDVPNDWGEAASKSQEAPLAKLRLIGTGFIIPGNIVLTAKHVVQQFLSEYQEWEKTRQGPLPRPIKLLFSTAFVGSEQATINMEMAIGAASHFSVANEYDMAAIKIADPPAQWGSPLPPSLELATSACEEGDEVGVCGYPLGLALHSDLLGGFMVSPSFSRGIVSAILPHPKAPLQNRTVLQIDAIINPGNSGGPVFDVRTGKAIGVVVGRAEQSIQTAPGQLLGGETRIVIPVGLARALPIHHSKLVIDSLNQAVAAGAVVRQT